ncbi:MAG: hypothetical protein O3C27_17635, partial [Actinomycetota bacterium]|nr:hypothetical protein [Actinomycetota bacterium]
MANTNATVNSAIIAQTALTTLLAKFPILARIATDFSSGSVKFNQDIVTHIVTPTVAQDFNPATGYVPDDQAQVDVSVKIDKHAYAGYAITDVERSTSQIDLNQRYADKVAYALGRKVCDDLMALIVAANFTNETEVDVVDFGRNTVVDIGTKLNKRFIPDMGRFMFVNSDYYNALQKDEALYKAYITPAASNVVVTGMLPDVNGFAVIEYSALPENAEDLVGFAGIREGLIMAARVPDVPQNTGDTVIRVVT